MATYVYILISGAHECLSTSITLQIHVFGVTKLYLLTFTIIGILFFCHHINGSLVCKQFHYIPSYVFFVPVNWGKIIGIIEVFINAFTSLKCFVMFHNMVFMVNGFLALAKPPSWRMGGHGLDLSSLQQGLVVDSSDRW